MSAGPIWQPPDGFGGGGDAVQERMRVNQLRALRGLPPIGADPTPVPSALNSRLLGRAPAAPTYQFQANKPAPPVDTSQQRSVFDELGEGPSPSWKPLTPVGGALYGLGLAAAEPEAMTPRNVAANVGMSTLQALTPRRSDGVQEDVLYPAYHGTTKAFDEYDPSRSQDLGVHFGTLEQAQNRVGSTEFHGGVPTLRYGAGANIRPVNVDMDNPVTLPDIFSMGGSMVDTANQFIHGTPLRWNPEDAHAFGQTARKIDELEEKRAFSPASSSVDDLTEAILNPSYFTTADRALHAAYKKQFWGQLERTVRDNGYDGVIYSNRAEGPGDSYIAFDPRQVSPRFGGPQPEPQQTVQDPLAKLLFKIKADLGPTPVPKKAAPAYLNPAYLPESVFDYEGPMRLKAESLMSDMSGLQFNGQRKYDLTNAAKTMDALKFKASGGGSGDDWWGTDMPEHQLVGYSPYLTEAEKHAYIHAKATYNRAIENTVHENGYDGLQLIPKDPEPAPLAIDDPKKAQELLDQLHKHLSEPQPEDPWGFLGSGFDPWEKHLSKFDER